MGGTGQCSWYSVSLQAGRSRDQIPLEATFSATVHIRLGAHPSSYTVGIPRHKVAGAWF
jgi:hypothetical protein